MEADKSKIIDRILGMIYGQCLGDAVGLPYEFKLKRDKHNFDFPYKEPVRGFKPCDWTDDTDHMILCMQSLVDKNLNLDDIDIATRLVNWVRHGFPEVGDCSGLGLGGASAMVINDPEFTKTPAAVAYNVWTNSGGKLAPNGSLMRTSILSALPDLKTVIGMSSKLSLITHADPRCTASCVMFNAMLHKIINGMTDHDLVLKESCAYARELVKAHAEGHTVEGVRHAPCPQSWLDKRFKTRDDELAWWVQTAYTGSLDDLQLDEMGKIGYVFKCLGCAVYALRVCKYAAGHGVVPSFKKVIMKIAQECGDADTNCAVAGALLGAFVGYSNLPKDWLRALPNKRWLDSYTDKFMTLLFGSDYHPLVQDSAPVQVSPPQTEVPTQDQ